MSETYVSTHFNSSNLLLRIVHLVVIKGIITDNENLVAKLGAPQDYLEFINYFTYSGFDRCNLTACENNEVLIAYLVLWKKI